MGKHIRNRLTYLDWLRGIGAVIMLQGHVFHSFTKPELRNDGPYVFSQFVGGMPPAIFLFLTGVTLAFLMDSTEKKGIAAWQRITTALRRAAYLFGLAVAFRIQLWLFAWPAPWTDLLRVDILNAMGFGIAMFSSLAIFRTRERIRLAAVAGFAIAFGAPLVSQVDVSFLPVALRTYVVPDYGAFSFFPWAAYMAFGISAGSIIRVLPFDMTDRAMQWCALTGGVLIVASQYFAAIPYTLYPKSEYWLNSPAQVLTKQGVTLVILAFAYLWTRYGAAEGSWSWVRQLGTASLLVYWVHIELVYGRWFYFWKDALTVPQILAASAGLILLMVALATAKNNYQRIAEWFTELRWGWGTAPGRVSGD